MNTIFKRPMSTASLIESIKAKIATEKGLLAAFLGRHGAAALDAETGDDKHLNEVTSEITKVSTRLNNLQSALIEAEKRQHAEITAQQEAEWQAKVENFKKKTDRHSERAERLRQAAGTFVEAYKKFVESGAECLRAYPTGGLPPPGSIYDPYAIHHAVARELARQQEPVLGEPATNRVPGSAMAENHYNPNDIKSLFEEVFDSNAFALKTAKKGRPK